MVHTYTISFFEHAAQINFIGKNGAADIDHIPDEIIDTAEQIRAFLTDYKSPKQLLEEQIVKDFIKNATVEDLLAKPELFPSWKSGEPLAVDEIVENNGRLWRSLKTHVASLPPGHATKDLYKEVKIETDEILAWRDTTEPGRDYMQGEKYIDEDGIVWESNCDNNFNNAVDYPAGWRRLGTLEEYSAREELLSGS